MVFWHFYKVLECLIIRIVEICVKLLHCYWESCRSHRHGVKFFIMLFIFHPFILWRKGKKIYEICLQINNLSYPMKYPSSPFVITILPYYLRVLKFFFRSKHHQLFNIFDCNFYEKIGIDLIFNIQCEIWLFIVC